MNGVNGIKEPNRLHYRCEYDQKVNKKRIKEMWVEISEPRLDDDVNKHHIPFTLYASCQTIGDGQPKMSAHIEWKLFNHMQ